MLMEAEGRNDREEELLLHDLSVAEFEMLKKNPQTTRKTPSLILIFLMLKSLI